MCHALLCFTVQVEEDAGLDGASQGDKGFRDPLCTFESTPPRLVGSLPLSALATPVEPNNLFADEVLETLLPASSEASGPPRQLFSKENDVWLGTKYGGLS